MSSGWHLPDSSGPLIEKVSPWSSVYQQFTVLCGRGPSLLRTSMCFKEGETKCCLRPSLPLTLIFRTSGWHLKFKRTMRRACFGFFSVWWAVLQSLWTVNLEDSTAVEAVLQSWRHTLCLCWWACGNILGSLNLCHTEGWQSVWNRYLTQQLSGTHADQETFASHFSHSYQNWRMLVSYISHLPYKVFTV